MKTSFLLFSILWPLSVFGQWSTIDMPSGRIQVGGTSYDGKVYIAGGIDGSFDYTEEILVYDSNEGTWSTIALSEGRAKIGVAAGDGLLFCGGGIQFEQPQNYSIVDKIDVFTGEISVDTLSAPRTELSAVTVGNKVLFAGGVEILNIPQNPDTPVEMTVHDAVDIYDLTTDTWSTAQLSQARGGMAHAVIGEKAFFAGGYLGDGTVSNVVDIYDASTDTWTTDTLSLARAFYGSGTSQGTKVYFAGGILPGDAATNLIDIFDTTTNSWSTDTLSAARWGVQAASLGDRVFFSGGGTGFLEGWRYAEGSDVVDIYNTISGEWTKHTMAGIRFAHVCASAGNQLLIGAGFTSDFFDLEIRADLFTDFSTVFSYVDEFVEDFETATTNSDEWTLEGPWEIGTSNDISSQYFPIPNHTTFAGINDDAPGETFRSVGKLISPPIIRTQDRNYLLQLDAYFIDGDNFGGEETLAIQYSTDKVNWITVQELEGDDAWQEVLAIIPKEQIGVDTIHIAFDYDDEFTWAYGIGIDDIAFAPAPDYLLLGSSDQLSPYTVIPRSQLDTIRWKHQFTNYGIFPVTDVDMRLTVNGSTSGSDRIDQVIASIDVGETVEVEFGYRPLETDMYSFFTTASHPDLGEIFYQTDFEVLEVSDSTLARDDGTRESGLGFGFGNPIWYGYYGSEFQLINPDTLSSISVRITPGSDFTGSIHFTVTTFDEVGTLNTELFHSEELPLEEYMDANQVVTYHLPEPLPLFPGRYVFAAGQDTIQGIIGFGFDTDNVTEEGFWLVSPVAGGGYPWANATNRETLMIRPHFKTSSVVTSTKYITKMADVKVYPNPFTNEIFIELPDAGRTAKILLKDLQGRIISAWNASNAEPLQIFTKNLAAGVYILEITNSKYHSLQKVVKQ